MKYRADRGGLRQLIRSNEVQQAIKPDVERGAEAARSAAPVDSGRLRDSIRVEEEEPTGLPYRRRGWSIVADVPYASVAHDRTRFMDSAVNATEGEL